MSGHNGRQLRGRQGGPSRGSRRLASQQEPNVEFVPSPSRVPVGRAVEGSTPAFVMNCRSRLVHRPEARCGWPYGVRQFFRLDAMPPGPKLCRRCFTSETVDVDEPEPVDSSSSQRADVGLRLGSPDAAPGRPAVREYLRGARPLSGESRATCRSPLTPPPPWQPRPGTAQEARGRRQTR